MLRATLHFILSLLLVLGVPATAHSAEPQTLRLNVSPDGYPPYTIVSKNGISGIVWDVVTEIGQTLGYQVEARKIPRKRVDPMLLEGYIDATARAREWTEHPEHFVFTAPIVRVQEVFFVAGQSALEYRKPEDLNGMTVLTHLGYKYPYLREMFKEKKAARFDVSTDRDMLSYLLHGEDHFDVAISDLLVGQWLIRKNGWKGRFSASDGALTDFGLSLMVRPDMADFARRFDEHLAAMKANGDLDRILARYR